MIYSMARPIGVEVSNFSVAETKEMRFDSRMLMKSAKSRMERLIRSKR